MSNEDQSPPEPHVDKLDADAVCANCGTVNPEGVFICNTCGNNLRDQRQLRLHADHELDLATHGNAPRRYWLLGILSVVGVVLVMLAAVYPEETANWFVNLAGGGEVEGPAAFWEGPEAPLYDRLAAGLEGVSVDQAMVRAVQESPWRPEPIAGLCLVLKNGGLIGVANVRQEEQRVFFAAQLTNGAALRGHGRMAEEFPSISSGWGETGVQVGGAYYEAAGRVVEQPGEWFDGYGEWEQGEDGTRFALYFLPGGG